MSRSTSRRSHRPRISARSTRCGRSSPKARTSTNTSLCDACPFIAQLYTPAIPTPRDGYAFEGKQGNFSFAGFDAVGTGRNDGASAVAYRSPDNQWSLTAQTVAANFPGLTDHVDTGGISFNDNKHVSAYFDYGTDHGTNVVDRTQAQRYDVGTYLYTNTFGFAASARKVGTVLRAGRRFRSARRHRGICAVCEQGLAVRQELVAEQHPVRRRSSTATTRARRAEPDRHQHVARRADARAASTCSLTSGSSVPAAGQRRLHADLAERRRPDVAQRYVQRSRQQRFPRLVGDADQHR